MAWMQPSVLWWLDFVAGGTVLLAVVLIAGRLICQPVQRMALAWSAIVGLFVLAVCCAAPNWPRLAPFASDRPVAVREKPESELISAEELLKTVKPEHLLSAPPKPTTGVEIIAVDSGDTVKWMQIPAPSSAVKLNPMSLVSAVLLGGSIATIAWLVYGQLRAWRLCRGAKVAPDFVLQELRTLVGGRTRVPRVLVDTRFSTAGAIGLWRPAILLPADVAQVDSTDGALRALLAHEYAHIERGDLWLLALGRLLLVVLYAHPLYWLLRRQILADQELIADAAAADYCGRHKYAETLVAWVRRRPMSGVSTGWALGVWERPSQLSRRIAMLLNERIRLQRTCSRGWRVASAFAMLVLVAGLSLFTLNRTAPAKDESPANLGKSTNEAAPVSLKAPASEAKSQAADVAEISGRCVDLKRKPVADARVLVFRVDHSDKTHLVPHGRTKMAKAAIEGAMIKSQLSYSYINGDPDKQRIIGEARTDATGRFRLSNLKADEAWLSQEDQVYVVIQAPGKGTIETMAMLNHVGKRLVAVVNPTMLAAASLRGRITDAEGKPIAGALVHWAEMNPLPKPVPGIYCAKTDADGRYEINDLYATDLANQAPAQVTPFGAMQTESMVLSVEHPAHAPGIIEFTKVPSEHDLVLHRPAILRGQINDFDGKPAEKAYVSWTHESGLSDGAWTDSNGKYSLPRLMPGKYTVAAGRPDRVKSSQEKSLASGEQRLDLQLRQGAQLKVRIVGDSQGISQNAMHSMINQLQSTVDRQDPMKAISGNLQPDGSYSMTVVPGRNFIHLVNPDLKVVDEKWAKQGIELAAGQSVEIELRVAPRPGGWSAWIDEMNAAAAAEKGLPAPPRTKPTDQVANAGESEEERMMKQYMDWPVDMLPEKPMSEEAVMQWLSGLNEDVTYKTIDGEDCVTSIMVGGAGPGADFDPQFRAQIIWVEYSLLAHIDKFPHLESLGLVGSSCDGKWLTPLSGHKELQGLVLAWTQNVTPDSIKIFATMPKLKSICMTGGSIDDGVLREFSRLPKLETLSIGGPFTDGGVESLRGNSKLTTLGLYTLGRGKITDESLRHVSSLPNLEHFGIASMGGNMPSLTDQGLEYLGKCTKLKELTVQGERVTDAGLFHLYGLKGLEELNVSDTSVTQKGIDELKQHLPSLKVTPLKKRNVNAEASKQSPAERRR